MSFALLLWRFQNMVVDVVLGNLLFISTFVLAMRALFKAFHRSLGYKDLLLAILISSCFKMFLIAMMVWECPVILIIDLFVLSSNTVALKGVCLSWEIVFFVPEEMVTDIKIVYMSAVLYIL